MFLQTIIAMGLGALLGIFSGLVPGLHINIIAAAIIGMPFIRGAPNEFFPCLIFSAASAQIFSSFIPAVFLGAPGSENFISALPGHKLLLLGRGVRAVFLTGTGALLSMLFSIMLLPLFAVFSPKIYSFAEPGIPYVLIAVSLSMILREENFKKKFWALSCFLLSGAFGLIILNSQIRNPLTPMLSGLFGAGMIISSMAKKQKIPEQGDEACGISGEELKSVPAAALSGGLVCTFPALGPGQAAAIASEVSSSKDERYLILTGGISAANLILSLATAFAIGKARNGATALAVQAGISLNLIITLACCALAAGAVAFGASMGIARIFSGIVPRINYFLLCAFSLLVISSITAFSSGITGVIALFSCAALGIAANISGINRTSLMGCLIIPVVLNYFL
jgi:putative membrane protein